MRRELVEVGDGLWAWMQLPGSWGWNNAGLITADGESLLVDTLFDRKLTRDMLGEMRKATPAADRIARVVNTHGNGDHCYGNGEVADAEIIGTQGCVDDLIAAPASRNATLMKAARIIGSLGPVGRGLGRVCGAFGIETPNWLLDAGPFAQEVLGAFEFAGNEMVLPNHVFAEHLEVSVGGRRVELIEVGPAHTLGDAIVYLPDDKVLYSGDILFKDAHPLIWEGPTSNWIAACERILAMDVETVVPGHGPLTDLSGIAEARDYLVFLTEETQKRYDAGMSVHEAIRDMEYEAYKHWIDPERVVVNVRTIYREIAGDERIPEVLQLFAEMARYREGRL